MALTDGLVTATILAVTPSYAFAECPRGIRYFIYARAVERTGPYDFDDLRPGAQVRFIPISGPQGMRGIDVQILSLTNPLDGR